MKTDAASTSPESTSTAYDGRLARYCVAGAAGVAAFAGTVTTADAAVTFVNFNSQVITDTTLGDSTFTLFNIDLDGNGTVDFRLGQRSGDSNGGGVVIVAPTGGTLGVVGISSAGYNYGAKLAKGATIGATAAFLTLSGSGFSARASLASGAGFTNSKWATPSPANGYLGIRFTGVNGTEYGYLHLSIASNTNPGARVITLIDAAYDTTANAAILAGAGEPAAGVPEPSTVTALGLAALGAAGLAANRRRKAAREQAA